MTKFEAVMAIVGDQYLRRRKAADYRRMKRALAAIGLTAEEQDQVLLKAEYHTAPNTPYEWAQA
jgi:hypothetical protein